MKTIGIMIGILALLAFVPLAFAEENDTPSTNVTPILFVAPPANETNETEDLNESDASGFKPFIQELKVMFEFNKERKAHLELELARLRLIQAKIAAKTNNTDAMEQAISSHNRIMERIRAEISEISNKGGNLTGLERAIYVHELRIEKLNSILESANLTAEQKAKIEARIQHVENVTWKLKALEAKMQERLNKSSDENETEEENELEENETAGCTTGTCGKKTCPLGNDTDDDETEEELEENESEEVGTCTSCGCGNK
jgi:uncharacterized coiled-coil protein SlyX